MGCYSGEMMRFPTEQPKSASSAPLNKVLKNVMSSRQDKAKSDEKAPFRGHK
jgi:hypothetical protein